MKIDNGMFGGQQFVFNLGGGPGFRVHQFGGGRPRRRPRDANGNESEQQQSMLGILTNLLPLIVLFVLPLLSSIFSPSDSTPSGPEVRFESDPPFTLERSTPSLHMKYFINPQTVEDYTPKMFGRLDRSVERNYIGKLQLECQGERQQKARLINQAQGIIFQDKELMRKAKMMQMQSCQRLTSLGLPYETY